MDGIGRDVRARRELGRSMFRTSVFAIACRQSAEVLEEENLYSFFSKFDIRTAEEIALLEKARGADEELIALMTETQELDGKKYINRDDPKFRFVLRVLEEGDGLVSWRESGAAGGNDTKGEAVMLEAGEEREGEGGAIRSIASAPHIGGRLTADFPGKEVWWLPRRKGLYVDGLVSPETGDPQVDLQILMKG